MRDHGALLLSLLLCACSVETGNEAEQAGAADANEVTATGDVGESAGGDATAPPGTPPPEQPGTNGQAAEPAGEVVLSAAPGRTTAGGTMTLTLRNDSREQIGYNLCSSAIETSGGRPVPTDRICTMELRLLEAGRSANYSYELPEQLADGTYRFLAQVEWMGSNRRSGVRSNSFEVR